MLDVGWRCWLVVGCLLVGGCSFLFNGEVKKEGCTQVGFVLLSFPFPFSTPRANGRFFRVECLKKERHSPVDFLHRMLEKPQSNTRWV